MRTIFVILKSRTLVLLSVATMVFAACHTADKDVVDSGQRASDSLHLSTESDDNSDFVAITDVVPDAILEIRYYGTYNFVGARIDGYEQPIALMTRQAADSLKAVSDDLMGQGYRLKIYDVCGAPRMLSSWPSSCLLASMTAGSASCAIASYS